MRGSRSDEAVAIVVNGLTITSSSTALEGILAHGHVTAFRGLISSDVSTLCLIVVNVGSKGREHFHTLLERDNSAARRICVESNAQS